MILKVFCYLVLLAGFRVFGATNEYYTKAEVKKIVDEVIKAYGGEEKLNALEKIHGVMEVKEGPATTRFDVYESRKKTRLDVTMAGLKVQNYYDGQRFVSVANGKVGPMPEFAKEDLEEEIRNGVFQAEVVDVFKNKEHQVLYLGRKKYDGKEYDLIETTDKRGKTKEHYIDPETHRRMVEIRRDEKGVLTVVTEAFGEYEGVLYEKRVTMKRADGSVGFGRVLEVTKDFDDSVFVPPATTGRDVI